MVAQVDSTTPVLAQTTRAVTSTSAETVVQPLVEEKIGMLAAGAETGTLEEIPLLRRVADGSRPELICAHWPRSWPWSGSPDPVLIHPTKGKLLSISARCSVFSR